MYEETGRVNRCCQLTSIQTKELSYGHPVYQKLGTNEHKKRFFKYDYVSIQLALSVVLAVFQFIRFIV